MDTKENGHICDLFVFLSSPFYNLFRRLARSLICCCSTGSISSYVPSKDPSPEQRGSPQIVQQASEG
ncbi:hypothetical protein JTE90_001762 [Oedothorax gibbosus]|uniref:Uncharacterized protein n=1 Tax=Oedothorax gibbosus TaxID=931172 RepID=A0AAV6VT20_9ARAC|nr:hypothetical protein JTE90_001762 [Oedothorax gibbosus]